MSNFCVDNDIIDVAGLCEPSSINLEDPNNWTQIFVEENLIIPEQKPDIEQINSINITAQIIRQKVIVTPTSTGVNFEGKRVTGRKLIIEGLLCQTIFYTADLKDQPLHSAHFAVPFSAYIVVPGTTNLDQKFNLVTCIEDLFVKECCSRQIFKNVTLLLQAIPIPNIECPNEC